MRLCRRLRAIKEPTFQALTCCHLLQFFWQDENAGQVRVGNLLASSSSICTALSCFEHENGDLVEKSCAVKQQGS